MQELEKILEEIDKTMECGLIDYINGDPVITKKKAKDIIHKHMNSGWIPVEKELPPNAKQKGAFCQKYQVMTKYGVTEGWYNPDYESWFCLFWFVSSKFAEEYIDFDHGDVPKRVRIEKGLDIVLAWRPLPEPYHPERSDNHDGE